MCLTRILFVKPKAHLRLRNSSILVSVVILNIFPKVIHKGLSSFLILYFRV